jgi:hypothetical protein
MRGRWFINNRMIAAANRGCLPVLLIDAKKKFGKDGA